MTVPGEHDLPKEQLTALFEREVREFVFGGYRPSSAPLLVLVGGQPGAGKSQAMAELAQRHPGGGLVPLTGDALRRFHPAYRRLLDQDPLGMPNATVQAVGAWVRMAIGHARRRRYSLLLEGVFGDPQVVVATAQRFAEAGYRTEIVALAVREERSRLDTLNRYLHPGGAPARWTPPTAHDASYQRMPETIAAAEASPSVHRIRVIDRAGAVLFANERTRDGVWEGPVGAVAALLAERQRPFEQAEARAWLASYRRNAVTLIEVGQLNDRTRAVVERLAADADRILPMGWPDRTDPGRLAHLAVQRHIRRVLDARARDAVARPDRGDDPRAWHRPRRRDGPDRGR